MRKMLALLLTLALLLALSPARAEEAPSPYSVIRQMLDGRSWTMTAAVTDVQAEAGAIPFETAALRLWEEADAILCEGTLNGGAVLTARMTAEGFAYECAMIADGPQAWTWAEMPPSASLETAEDGFSLSLRLNGLDYEHITISIDLDGSWPEGYEGEFGYTLMKGSGEIYGLWDVFSAQAGETGTELIISLVNETCLTGEGVQTVETGVQGMTVTRVENVAVLVDDVEAGTATLTRTVTWE
ncbi:MAG: hypothetical protein IKH77_03550 [Clostridia bacterium]|nr:hypothetical protein [Clostridia bacterium]